MRVGEKTQCRRRGQIPPGFWWQNGRGDGATSTRKERKKACSIYPDMSWRWAPPETKGRRAGAAAAGIVQGDQLISGVLKEVSSRRTALLLPRCRSQFSDPSYSWLPLIPNLFSWQMNGPHLFVDLADVGVWRCDDVGDGDDHSSKATAKAFPVQNDFSTCNCYMIKPSRPLPVRLMTSSPRIILTGASRGLGLAILRLLLTRHNARVATLSRSFPSELKAVQEQHTDRVLVIQGDVGVPADNRKVIQEAVTKWEGIDGLVLNASSLEPLGKSSFSRGHARH